MFANTKGNIIIEFALAMPILLLMLVGMLDLSRYALQKSALLQGAREGAQYGMVNSSDTSGIESTAVNATGLTGVTATDSVFCECVNGTAVSCSTTCSSSTLKKYITVTTTRSFTSVLSGSSLTLNSYMSWTPPTSITATVTMSVP